MHNQRIPSIDPATATGSNKKHFTEILIDPFLSDNPSRDNGWSGYLTGKNSTRGGDR
jgi:hypothetical protein